MLTRIEFAQPFHPGNHLDNQPPPTQQENHVPNHHTNRSIPTGNNMITKLITGIYLGFLIGWLIALYKHK